MSDLPPYEGLAFYLVLDRSGSMGKIVDHAAKEGAWEAVTRFDRLQSAAIGLIHTFPNDLIGVIAFARAAEIIAPLTLDHKLLDKRIRGLGVIKDVKQDGTSIGYAIYKTSHLIAASKAFSAKDDSAPYKILSAFMIIITDGLQDPSLLDKGNRLRTMELEEAAAFAKEKNIKVFIVNIDPRINEEQFAPNRREMERITAATGGRLIIASQLDELQKILLQIPKEEMSKIYPDEDFIKTTRVSFYPYFVVLSLVLFAFSLVLDQTIWRRAL
jgi:Ca-activated chloride channel family protein